MDLRQDALNTFVAELRAEYATTDKSGVELDILPIQCDVSDEMSVKDMMQAAVKRFGRIDYAVNGAGITNKSKVGEYQTSDVSHSVTIQLEVLFRFFEPPKSKDGIRYEAD